MLEPETYNAGHCNVVTDSQAKSVQIFWLFLVFGVELYWRCQTDELALPDLIFWLFSIDFGRSQGHVQGK